MTFLSDIAFSESHIYIKLLGLMLYPICLCSEPYLLTDKDIFTQGEDSCFLPADQVSTLVYHAELYAQV